jgi:hypothetical protein
LQQGMSRNSIRNRADLVKFLVFLRGSNSGGVNLPVTKVTLLIRTHLSSLNNTDI